MRKLVLIVATSFMAAVPAPALAAKHHVCHKHHHHHCLRHKKKAASTSPVAKPIAPASAPTPAPGATEPLPPGTVEIAPDELEWVGGNGVVVEGRVPHSLQEEEAMIREIEKEMAESEVTEY
jgi:hypothetical protein